jgi:DNA-binding NtrC family response regulator
MKQKTVLFVDDDERMLASLRRAFIDEPYTTLLACGAREAISLLRKHEIHVLVTDLRMPDMSGLDLLQIVQSKYPGTILIVLSGQPQLAQPEVSAITRGVHEDEIFAFAAKSDGSEELRVIIRKALDSCECRIPAPSLLRSRGTTVR